MTKPSGIKKLGVAYFLLKTQFWFPIWVIFLLDKGISFSDVLIADIIYNGTVILLEVPAGMLSDRLGRRNIYALGALLGAITYFLMTLIENFWLLILCWLMWSAFMAVISGTDTAYIYELLKQSNAEHRAKHVFGYFAAIASLAFVISHLTAGYLYSFDINLPIYLNSSFALTAVVVIFLIPPITKDIKSTTYAPPTFKDILNVAWSDVTLLSLVLVYAVINGYHWTMTILFQPFLRYLGIEVQEFGIIYLSFTVGGIVSGILAGKLVDRMGNYKLVISSFLSLVITIGLTAILSSWYSLIPLITLNFLVILCQTPLQVMINIKITNDERSAIFSLSNLITSLLLVFSRPFVGYITEIYSFTLAFFVWFGIGLVFLIGVISLLGLVKKADKKTILA